MASNIADDIDLHNKDANQNQDFVIRSSVKRKRSDVYCCVVCKLTSGWNRHKTLQHRLENIRIKDDDDDDEDRKDIVESGEKEYDLLGDLHTFKKQVVITANNAPAPAGFKLSLDFLPCYEPDTDGGGWIAAASSPTGLLLCTTSQYSQSQYYICNPFTRKWVALPLAPRVHDLVHVGFIFEPCSNNSICGHQQLICSECKFQVVRFHDEYQCQQMHPRTRYEVETFLSETGQWTIETVSSSKPMRWNGGSVNHQSVLHNGRLHWPAGRNIVVYDPYAKKLLGVIDPPSRLQRCQSSTLAGVSLSGGSLWISQYAEKSLDFRFWKLSGYGDMPAADNLDGCYWRPMYKFNVKDLTDGPNKWGPRFRGCYILGMHPNHPNIVYLKLDLRTRNGRSGCCLAVCNLRTKTLGQPRVWNVQFQNRGDVVALAQA